MLEKKRRTGRKTSKENYHFKRYELFVFLALMHLLLSSMAFCPALMTSCKGPFDCLNTSFREGEADGAKCSAMPPIRVQEVFEVIHLETPIEITNQTYLERLG